jgi:Golgi nucleoside diphosphatase
MNNFLWRVNGLFTNNGSASFVGVVPSRARDATSPNYATNPGLTWTRGYLLKKYSNQSSGTPIYTAIFDAGSSGTRISLYEVTPGLKATIVPKGITGFDYDDSGINDFMSGQGTIGTSGLPNQQLPSGCSGTSNLGQSDVGPCVLQPLLNYVTTQLPVGIAASSVKIELFATAGMRTEDIKNGGAFTSAQITNFYDNIMKPYVRTTQLTGGVTYNNVGDFKTINGNSEEGVWSWINLNDVFYNTFTTQGTCGNSPIGNFEVGGSSMQVAFPVTNTSVASDANNIYQVNINGCAIKVYSKTFLGLGGDDARKFMRAYNY